MALAFLLGCALGACGDVSGDVSGASDASSADGGAAADATRASVAPTLKAGVDPAIFLPTVVAGYHPTAEELATSGKPCASDADCKTSSGQVVFHCSTPYYGQAQCQGAFPPGDQVVPGVTPSCAYYDCPSGFECEAEPSTHAVACLESQHHGGRDAQ